MPDVDDMDEGGNMCSASLMHTISFSASSSCGSLFATAAWHVICEEDNMGVGVCIVVYFVFSMRHGFHTDSVVEDRVLLEEFTISTRDGGFSSRFFRISLRSFESSRWYIFDVMAFRRHDPCVLEHGIALSYLAQWWNDCCFFHVFNQCWSHCSDDNAQCLILDMIYWCDLVVIIYELYLHSSCDHTIYLKVLRIFLPPHCVPASFLIMISFVLAWSTGMLPPWVRV